jgi:hypothetical protein
MVLWEWGAPRRRLGLPIVRNVAELRIVRLLTLPFRKAV